VLIREKTVQDTSACLDLLMQVHELDGYPPYLPKDVPAFITPDYEVAAWVAECDGRVVGHVALHQASVDPTLDAAQRATGLPAERLVVISRLFITPTLRRAGVGRALLRHATKHAQFRWQRAVLDVGQALTAPIALYESEGWERVDSLALRVGESTVLALWIYVSPDVGEA
jgi:GNAT superfamily N-acetyltransferase